MQMTITQTAYNLNYKVVLHDFTILKSFYGGEPEKKIGAKYAKWKRNQDFYAFHYGNTPYWVQVIPDDDDTIMQRELSDKQTALELFEDLATCQNTPDLVAMGFTG